MSKRTVQVFLQSFIVSGLTFKSSIQFEFIFVYGVQKCSNFIFLHVDVQFSQSHLLKRLFFPPFYILAPTVKNKVHEFISGLSILFHRFIFLYTSIFVIAPCCLDGCSFEVQSEVRKVDSSSCFAFLRFLWQSVVFLYRL